MHDAESGVYFTGSPSLSVSGAFSDSWGVREYIKEGGGLLERVSVKDAAEIRSNILLRYLLMQKIYLILTTLWRPN